MTAIKITVVGDHLVGKSCLIYTFLCRSYPKIFPPIVLDGTYDIIIQCDNMPVKHIIYDTRGTDDYKELRPYSYPNTDIFIICFSLQSRKSLDNVKKIWVSEIKNHCPDVPYILVGTKYDLKDNQISSEKVDEIPVLSIEGEEMKNKINAENYIECSSLTNYNVDEVFYSAIRIVLRKMSNKSKSHCSLC